MSRWICVKNSLPNFGIDVLGVNQFSEVKVCYRDKPWSNEPEQWFVDLFGVFYPTHWMYLPELPDV